MRRRVVDACSAQETARVPDLHTTPFELAMEIPL